ncbi:MAG TPA: EAL domain-containing protein [Candidatus Competibacter sp.]|nr:EAL domain-containing protein [Candidatus Competibacter sp.]
MTVHQADMADNPVFLGRQPILDRDQRIVAYELLFRASVGVNSAIIEDDFTATAEVVVRAFTELGLASVLGDCLGYINADERFLASDLVELLPRERVVLEVLETVQITPSVIARLRELKEKGLRLALDDIGHVRPDQVPAMDLVDVIKVDLLALGIDELPSAIEYLKRWPAKLLAEKIDDGEQFRRCAQLGFELFQGYYFAKPTILVGRRVDPARAGVLRLMNLLLGDAEANQLEQEFKRYPNLTYNLLRLVNSVAFGMPAKIDSLRRAIAILGRQQLQRWLQLLLFTQRAEGGPPSQPLLTLAATRGKLMELMMNDIAPGDRGRADQAFMVGVLSLLDTLFGVPLPELLAELNLANSVRIALLGGEGLLGQLLGIIRLYEQNQFAEMVELIAQLPELSLSRFNQAQLQSLVWANELSISNGR